MINLSLILLLIILNIVILVEKNHFRLILLFSTYSLFVAILYFMFNAPDVALSELVIGVAFIPLILTIAISKQEKVNVLFLIENQRVEKELKLFCRNNGLKYHRIYPEDLDNYYAVGVFSTVTVDIVVKRLDFHDEIVTHESSRLFENLSKSFSSKDHVVLRKVKEFEF